MAGPTVKGDIDVERDALVGRDAKVTRDASVGNDITVGNNLTVDNDASVKQDLVVDRDVQVDRDLTVSNNATVSTNLFVGLDGEIDRNFKALKPRFGLLKTPGSTSATSPTILDVDSPYNIFITGAAVRFLQLPEVSTTASDAFGNGTEFIITNDASADISNKVFITGPDTPPGAALTIIEGGQTVRAICTDASEIVGRQWEFIFDREPILFFIPLTSWIAVGDNFSFSIAIPSSHPNPTCTFFDNSTGDLILVDYQNNLNSSITITLLPEARFNARVVMS